MELGRWMKDLTTAGRQTWMRMEWKTIKLSDCKCPPDPPKLETNVWTEITSPNYPQVYCPNMNCQYFLTAPAGYQIIMNFTNFDTEAFEDRLAIFKGRNVTQKHQELYHGRIYFNSLLRFDNDTVTLLFVSDYSNQRSGFRILASCEPMYDNGFSSTHFIFSGMFLIMVLLASLGAVMFVNRHRLLPSRFFRNPVYIPTVVYSEGYQADEPTARVY
ncbi:hypothetical protein WR25_14010 isoform A [Diploscapter pachys]|uniref:CUB domain-containing protein n=1 Tax=Diploscapter pachys TaxID=2018661 RepID=A0A2A2KVF5_9BILA|nr:hypothetical protein WR25_14010 isoform A [Diploscapter pachys]